MAEFLIVCPLCLIAGFVDSIAGGGGLISLPAFLLAGVPVHASLATNKLQATMGIIVSTLKYATEGYMVPSFVAVGIVCGLIGSGIGTNLALLTDDFAFRIFMLVALPFVVFYVLRTKDFSQFAQNPLPTRKALVITACIALVIGAYDGFYGPGTGTFLLLLLTRFAHQSLREAAGTTKAINLSTNATSMVVFLANGQTLIPLGLVAGVFSIIGNWLGARFFAKEGSRIARPIMLVVISIFALKLIADLAADIL